MQLVVWFEIIPLWLSVTQTSAFSVVGKGRLHGQVFARRISTHFVVVVLLFADLGTAGFLSTAKLDIPSPHCVTGPLLICRIRPKVGGRRLVGLISRLLLHTLGQVG